MILFTSFFTPANVLMRLRLKSLKRTKPQRNVVTLLKRLRLVNLPGTLCLMAKRKNWRKRALMQRTILSKG